MLDDVIRKSDEARVQLSKTLSAFEQECVRLRGQYNEEFDSVNNKIKSGLEEYKVQLNSLFVDQETKLTGLVEDCQKQLQKEFDKSLDDISKIIKARFESLYAEYEVEAQTRALQTFESDVKELFKIYGDKLAPYILKSLIGHIFRTLFKWLMMPVRFIRGKYKKGACDV